MRMRNKNKKLLIYMTILLCFCVVGLTALLTTMSINGTVAINLNNWNVKFQNIVLDTNNNVTGTQSISGNTTVNYSITLSKPGDYYSFTVDAVNTGTIDAMINTITKTNLSADQAKLIDYNVTYVDDISINQNDILKKNNGQETIKISLKYKEDVSASDLPSTKINLNLSFSLTYVQAGNTANENIHPTPVSFSTDSWDTIKSAVIVGTAQTTYSVGDTKSLYMGSLGTHTVRIANMSTPSACSGANFSQTACGFVIEFADIISTHVMNSANSNVGGWPASEMRSYVNNDIYNALPSDLKSAIIDTKVVSGHGSTSGESNFTSTDKLYLLSTHEVWTDGSSNKVSTNDTAYNNTRQLDYYEGLGVTTSSYSGATKRNIGSTDYWWLRTAGSDGGYGFFDVRPVGGAWYIHGAHITGGVSPAFRLG